MADGQLAPGLEMNVDETFLKVLKEQFGILQNWLVCFLTESSMRRLILLSC